MHGFPEVEIEEAPKPDPIEPLLVEGPTVSTAVLVTLGSMSVALSTSPAMSEEDLVTPVTTSAASVDELANLPLLQKWLVIQGVT